MKDYTYSEAIEKVMLENAYYAPLKLIYKNIWKYKDKSKVRGRTPLNTIQERVQRDERFVRIGLGVYALKEFADRLPKEVKPKNKKELKERVHARVQGMLLEIGNNKNDIADTYTNNLNWLFDNEKLSNIATLRHVPPFTYNKIISESVIYADVIWFNERGFPHSVFEVEHTTDFRDSFIKFMELQDFNVRFFCVSDENRIDKFNREKAKSAFKPIEKRLTFLSYKQVENDYENSLKVNYL